MKLVREESCEIDTSSFPYFASLLPPGGELTVCAKDNCACAAVHVSSTLTPLLDYLFRKPKADAATMYHALNNACVDPHIAGRIFTDFVDPGSLCDTVQSPRTLKHGMQTWRTRLLGHLSEDRKEGANDNVWPLVCSTADELTRIASYLEPNPAMDFLALMDAEQCFIDTKIFPDLSVLGDIGGPIVRVTWPQGAFAAGGAVMTACNSWIPPENADLDIYVPDSETKNAFINLLRTLRYEIHELFDNLVEARLKIEHLREWKVQIVVHQLGADPSKAVRKFDLFAVEAWYPGLGFGKQAYATANAQLSWALKMCYGGRNGPVRAHRVAKLAEKGFRIGPQVEIFEDNDRRLFDFNSPAMDISCRSCTQAGFDCPLMFGPEPLGKERAFQTDLYVGAGLQYSHPFTLHESSQTTLLARTQ